MFTFTDYHHYLWRYTNICEGIQISVKVSDTFIVLFCWDSYSQVPLKLRLNASSRHGDTLPSVFSINKKRFAIFWQSSISAPRGDRTRIAESADQWLIHYTIWAVDENVTYLGLFISSISSYVYKKNDTVGKFNSKMR